MRSSGFILLALILASSCNESEISSEEKPEITSNRKEKNPVGSFVPDESTKKNSVEFDFCSDCDSLEIWHGGIQGVNKHPESCCYVMAQCFTNRHYDLLVYSQNEVSLEEGTNHENKSVNKEIEDAIYYAFEIPKEKPKNRENGLKLFDYVFPSEVNVYQKKDGSWEVIKVKTVKSFEELGELKLNTILNTKL